MKVRNYLLTTGESTDKVEYYILDLFKLYFVVNPDDIPNSSIGFNKTLTNVTKPDLTDELRRRINDLIRTFKSKFEDVTIELKELEMIDESTFKIIVAVNSEVESYEISSGLY